MSGQRERLGAAGGAAAPGDQLATRGNAAAAAHHAPARAPRPARFSGVGVSAAAAQAAPAAPGAMAAPTPDNPNPVPVAGFWARLRRVFGGGERG
jgi:hypothetical protein